MAKEEGSGRGRRAQKRFKESELDFAAMREDLRVLRPRLLTEAQALELVADSLVEHHSRGVTVEQIVESLGRRGLVVTEDKVWEVLRSARGAE